MCLKPGKIAGSRKDDIYEVYAADSLKITNHSGVTANNVRLYLNDSEKDFFPGFSTKRINISAYESVKVARNAYKSERPTAVDRIRVRCGDDLKHWNNHAYDPADVYIGGYYSYSKRVFSSSSDTVVIGLVIFNATDDTLRRLCGGRTGDLSRGVTLSPRRIYYVNVKARLDDIIHVEYVRRGKRKTFDSKFRSMMGWAFGWR